jgi:AraC-like DNA-binding protein
LQRPTTSCRTAMRSPIRLARTPELLCDGDGEETRERAKGGALRAVRLATIRADVLANLSEGRLSAETIGKRHELSERYVHLLFEETGQTFSRFVEEERLKRAFAC